MKSRKLKKSAQQTFNTFKRSIWTLIAVLLLIALINEMVPKDLYFKIFTKNDILDSFIGAILGSIAAGNPLNSYVLGGEMLSQGVSMVAITAFILTWVTVGIIQMPAESMLLGRKFAVARNTISFISAIVISLLMAFILPLF